MTKSTVDSILRAENVGVAFASGGGQLHAVDGVSIGVRPGRTLALVGESGSGKTTLAMAMMRALTPTAGRILFEDRDITTASERSLRDFRRRVQMVFQDPYSSLDPRMTVERIVGEPLRAFGVGPAARRREQVAELLADVGLPEEALGRRPAQFSGGQRQRIAIARALALQPDLIVADEPASALDVSVQAQIVNLLQRLQRERGIAYLLVSHDLPLVYHLASEVAVMYLGRVIETGGCDELVGSPLHPYTAALLSAAPELDPDRRRDRILLSGSPPSAMDRPSGCAFHPRCPIARERCRTEVPALEASQATGRSVACFYPGELPGIQLVRTGGGKPDASTR